jgi:phytoene dehydrogenase-like protein
MNGHRELKINLDKKKVAIIGGGASGLTTAFLIQGDYDVTIFEKNDYLGGNVSTYYHDNTLNEMGVSVFTERTYPYFTRLLKILNVQTVSTTYNNNFSYTNQETGKKMSITNKFHGAISSLGKVLQIRRLYKDTLCKDFFNSVPWFDQSIKTEILYPILGFSSSVSKKDLGNVQISHLINIIDSAQFYQPFEMNNKRVTNN